MDHFKLPSPPRNQKNNTILAIPLSSLAFSLFFPSNKPLFSPENPRRRASLSRHQRGIFIQMTELAQVGVRTRARALAMAAAAVAGTSRKRKPANDAIVPRIDLRSGKNRRRVVITPEDDDSVSVSPPVESGQRSLALDRCGSIDRGCASCCSSNGSSDRRIEKYADLEDESVGVETSVYYSCRERRETTPSSELRAEFSDELDSMARPAPEANSRRRSTAERMPTDSELEEFFTEAEKNIQKQFADKYNYDIVKDKPLEGRYEWIRLKP